MCLVKTPKIKQTAETDPKKPVPILRNPLLDGIEASTNALRIGRGSLRIDRSPTAATAPSDLASSLAPSTSSLSIARTP